MKEWMLYSKEALRTFCRQYKLFTAILAAQALVVLYFAVVCLTPAATISVDLASFVATSPTAALSNTEGGIAIQNEPEVTSEVMLTTDAIALGAGAYTIDLAYTSIYNLDAPSGSMQEESAALFLTATGTQGLFIEMEETLLLTDAAQSLQSRIWVSRGQSVDNLQLTLYYSGVGLAEIESITLTEQVSWRWLQLFAVCFGFVLCDAAIYLVAYPACAKNERLLRRLRVFFALFGIATFASLPFFADFVYYGHDMLFHTTRIASVAAELANGQFPVRMMTEMMNGYGYANSLFYCDIFLYLPALVYNCMLPLQTAYQLYVFGVNFATVAFAYYAFYKMSHSTGIALVGGLVYTLASYRLINVYTRAALGEYTAMAFFPLVVLGLWRIYQSKKPHWGDWLPLALGMAGVFQCHVLSVEIIAIFLGIFCLLLIRQTLCLARIKALGSAVALCLGLSAWFLVPFVHSFLQMDLQATANVVTELQSSGLQLSELFSISAFSIGTGYADASTGAVYILGWGLLCGVSLALYLMAQHGKLGLSAAREYKPMCFTLLLGGIAALFTLAAFPWNAIGYGLHPIIAGVINLIQFAWRYLAVASVCFAVVTVFALTLLKQYQPRYFKAVLCGVVAVNIVLTGLFYTEFIAVTSTTERNTFAASDTLTIGWGEYLLEGSSASTVSTSLVQTDSEDVQIISYEKIDGVAYLTYENNSDVAQTLLLPIWNYPNYQVIDTLTGQVYEIAAGENNCIAITAQPNSVASLQVVYVVPVLWHIAEGVTLLSWAFVALLCFKKRKESKQ